MAPDEIEEIRRLLSELEQRQSTDQQRTLAVSFEYLELPALVGAVVDHLQPLLAPYEAAIYWFMFRHSIVKTGEANVRVSTRGLMKDVITSIRAAQTDQLSYGAVNDALKGLEEKGAIAKVGDTTRDGTPYRVMLPEEIPACQTRMQAAQKAELPVVDSARDLDYYNVRENRLRVFERDAYKCYKCGKQLTRFSATLDHLQPVSEGGDHSLGNLATACLHCNSRRGARPVSDIL